MEQDETQITVFSARNIVLFFIMLVGFIRIKERQNHVTVLLRISFRICILVWFIWFFAHRILELTLLSTIACQILRKTLEYIYITNNVWALLLL